MGFRGSVDFRAQGDDVKARKAHAEHHGKAETLCSLGRGMFEKRTTYPKHVSP